MSENSSLNVFKVIALISQAGLSISLPLVGFIYLSQLLARYLGNELLLLILGIFLGLGSGFSLSYRLLMKIIK